MSEEAAEALAEARQGVKDWIESHAAEFLPYAERIWRLAELGGQEFESSKLLAGLLRERGFTVEEGVAEMPTAFVARWGQGGSVVAFSVEYDALPGLSQQGMAAHNPVLEGAPGHGCGHNLLGVGGVLAAVAAKEWLAQGGRPGQVVVFGTPGEEICMGKPFMARAGLFEGLDAVLDWHPWTYNLAAPEMCISYFSLKYHFKGRTAHGNAPWHGRSALDAAMLTGQAIEYLREHIPPGDPQAAHTINYTFSNTGPEIPNVVPDRASLWVIGRLRDAELASQVLERLHRCAQGAALATETEVSTEFISATHEKLANQTLAEVVHRNFQWVGAPPFSPEEQEQARSMQRQAGAPEIGLRQDFLPFAPTYTPLSDNSEYSWFAPFAMLMVAIAPEGFGWHNWQVAACAEQGPGHKGLLTAAQVMAASAVELYLDPDLVARAKAEQVQQVAGRVYQPLFPPETRPPLELNRATMDKYRDRLAACFPGQGQAQ